jgi:hypothetical protein
MEESVNLSPEIKEYVFGLISFIALKENSLDATETVDLNRISRAVGKFYGSSYKGELVCSSSFEETQFSAFRFALLKEMLMTFKS